MHVAVDANNLIVDSRGMGRYVKTVLELLMTQQPGIRWTLMTHAFPPWSARGRLQKILDDREFAHARSVPGDAQVVWHPWNGTIFPSAKPSVVTMHDAVPFVYPAADRALRRREQEPFVRSARTASKILAVSQFVKDEVHKWLAFPLERIVVTPLATTAAFSPGPPRLPRALAERLGGRPYVLAFGAPDPRKNLDTLYEGWRAAFPNTEVALIGTGFDRKRAPEAIHVERTRDDDTIVGLYRSARIVAHPSLYEGFGLPVLEGMACGIPVAAVRATSVEEIGGDAAFWVDDPLDPAAWAAALRRLHTDETLRADLITRGVVHVKTFSWQRTAEATLQTLLSRS